MPDVASKLTRVALSSDQVISSGTIKVYGIFVSNATASDAEIVFTNAAGTPILNITVPANDSEDWSTAWLADAGLSVLSVGNADVVVTVAHSADGV